MNYPDLYSLLEIVSSHFFFKKSNDKMGKDTFISLAYFLLSKKKHLFCKLDLFSQNTDILHFPEDFCRYQRTTNE